MSSLINCAACKRAALSLAEEHRAHKFTRVSDSFLQDIEYELMHIIERKIKAQPSVGKTIK